MLQAAFGGYRNLNDVDVFTDAPNAYDEPSFDIMFPLDFESPKSKKIYILLRIRTNNAGTSFEAGTSSANRFTFTAKNATTGDDITASISTNSLNTGWDEPSFSPYVFALDVTKSVSGEDLQIDVIDCSIRDSNTNSCISFRIKVLDSQSVFNTLTVTRRLEHTRAKSSTAGGHAVIFLSKDGLYSILSPIVSFQESTRSNADFSYPDNTIFYQHEKSVNNETFDFSITGSSLPVVVDNIFITPLPDFHKVSVLSIDGKLQGELATLRENGWVDIEATGRISDVKTLFRIYFVPKLGGITIVNKS